MCSHSCTTGTDQWGGSIQRCDCEFTTPCLTCGLYNNGTIPSETQQNSFDRKTECLAVNQRDQIQDVRFMRHWWFCQKEDHISHKTHVITITPCPSLVSLSLPRRKNFYVTFWFAFSSFYYLQYLNSESFISVCSRRAAPSCQSRLVIHKVWHKAQIFLSLRNKNWISNDWSYFNW